MLTWDHYRQALQDAPWSWSHGKSAGPKRTVFIGARRARKHVACVTYSWNVLTRIRVKNSLPIDFMIFKHHQNRNLTPPTSALRCNELLIKDVSYIVFNVSMSHGIGSELLNFRFLSVWDKSWHDSQSRLWRSIEERELIWQPCEIDCAQREIMPPSSYNPGNWAITGTASGP